MSGVRYILVAEGAQSGGSLYGLRPDDGSGFSTTELENWLPPCETRWHKQFSQVTYTISVVGTTGTAPTTWSLGARFEQLLPHTQGYPDIFPVWAPLQDEQLAKCVLEGVGWYGPGQAIPSDASLFGTIVNQLTPADDGSGVLPSGLTGGSGGSIKPAANSSATLRTARVTVSRTVVNQLGGMRVRFQPAISGGDSTTKIVLSASAFGKA